MRQETVQYFTENEEELANSLVKTGVKKNVALVLVFLSRTPETTSREIERGTDMRQREISTAIKYLINQGWVWSRENLPEKKGRPVKVYKLVKPVWEIMDNIGKERQAEGKEKLADMRKKLVFIRKLRNYHDKTLQALIVILVVYGMAALIWAAGISLPAGPSPTFNAPPESPGLLTAPVPLSPGLGSSPGQQVLTLTPLLRWSEVDGADSYAVNISRSPYGPGDSVYSSKAVYGTSITVPGGLLLPGETYRWTVRAYSGAGAGNISSPLYFTIPAAGPIPPPA